jgi:YfiH family protein
MFLTSPLLSTLPGIRHAFFTRQGGVSEGVYASLNSGTGSKDDQDKVAENRRRMADHMGVAPHALFSLYQIHSPLCLVLDQMPQPGAERPQADASVTTLPGIACCAASADCGPILFADPVARIVGAAHAGWKGALGGVLESTLDRMVEKGAHKENIVCAIGPLIRQQSYEVSADFRAEFIAKDKRFGAFFIDGVDTAHAQFDLAGLIAFRLREAGVEKIDDLGLDTYADESRFYSYRRMTHRGESDYGRHIAAIALEPLAH